MASDDEVFESLSELQPLTGPLRTESPHNFGDVLGSGFDSPLDAEVGRVRRIAMLPRSVSAPMTPMSPMSPPPIPASRLAFLPSTTKPRLVHATSAGGPFAAPVHPSARRVTFELGKVSRLRAAAGGGNVSLDAVFLDSVVRPRAAVKEALEPPAADGAVDEIGEAGSDPSAPSPSANRKRRKSADETTPSKRHKGRGSGRAMVGASTEDDGPDNVEVSQVLAVDPSTLMPVMTSPRAVRGRRRKAPTLLHMDSFPSGLAPRAADDTAEFSEPGKFVFRGLMRPRSAPVFLDEPQSLFPGDPSSPVPFVAHPPLAHMPIAAPSDPTLAGPERRAETPSLPDVNPDHAQRLTATRRRSKVCMIGALGERITARIRAINRSINAPPTPPPSSTPDPAEEEPASPAASATPEAPDAAYSGVTTRSRRIRKPRRKYLYDDDYDDGSGYNMDGSRRKAGGGGGGGGGDLELTEDEIRALLAAPLPREHKENDGSGEAVAGIEIEAMAEDALAEALTVELEAGETVLRPFNVCDVKVIPFGRSASGRMTIFTHKTAASKEGVDGRPDPEGDDVAPGDEGRAEAVVGSGNQDGARKKRGTGRRRTLRRRQSGDGGGVDSGADSGASSGEYSLDGTRSVTPDYGDRDPVANEFGRFHPSNFH